MELLGENISTLRRQCGGKFSLGTTIRLGTQMVRAVEAIHRIGYLHRDVKPSNFAIGRGERRTTIVLFDFGLARRYKNERGDIRAPRNDVGFRGTARYASLRAHEGKELSRADDLWSVLYILTECLVGRLPWHYVKDRDEIGKMKREFLNPSLVAELPAEFRLFLDHLLALGYTARPDYDALCLALEELGHREDVLMRPLDWELVSTPPGAASNKAPIHTPDGAHTLVSPSRALDDGPRLHPTSPSHPTLLSPHHRALVARYHKFSPHDNSLETPVLRLHPPGWKHAPRGPGPPCLSSEEEPSLGTAFSSQPDPSPSMASISYCESVRSLPRSPLQPVWSPSLLGSARPPAPPLPPPPPPPPSTPPPDGTPISSRSAASTRSRRTPHGGSVHRLARVGPPPPGNEEESLLPSDSSAPGGSPSPLLPPGRRNPPIRRTTPPPLAEHALPTERAADRDVSREIYFFDEPRSRGLPTLTGFVPGQRPSPAVVRQCKVAISPAEPPGAPSLSLSLAAEGLSPLPRGRTAAPSPHAHRTPLADPTSAALGSSPAEPPGERPCCCVLL